MATLQGYQLHKALTQLDAQHSTFYSPREQQTLRQQLSSTIKTLHALCFKKQQTFVIALLPPEQQFLEVTLAAPVPIPLDTWQTVITKELPLLT